MESNFDVLRKLQDELDKLFDELETQKKVSNIQKLIILDKLLTIFKRNRTEIVKGLFDGDVSDDDIVNTITKLQSLKTILLVFLHAENIFEGYKMNDRIQQIIREGYNKILNEYPRAYPRMTSKTKQVIDAIHTASPELFNLLRSAKYIERGTVKLEDENKILSGIEVANFPDKACQFTIGIKSELRDNFFHVAADILVYNESGSRNSANTVHIENDRITRDNFKLEFKKFADEILANYKKSK